MPLRTTLFILISSFTLYAASAESLARQVTIYRDHWGTPHVFGKTDQATAFGFGYAQSEDNFPQIEEDFVLGVGRGAELYGPDLLKVDLLNRTLRIEEYAKADYEGMDPRMRSICEGYVAGIGYYLQRHPEVRPRLITKMQPWYPLAFIRYSYYQIGFADYPKLRPPNDHARLDPKRATSNGSNGWVIGPSRSADGQPMLFIDPHLPFYGPGQVYEGHIHSGEGWEFSGYARFGFPFPYVGHNSKIGWMSTDNLPDSVDGYLEVFPDPAHPLNYVYGNCSRTAEAREVTIRVTNGSRLIDRRFQTLWTVHGPIIRDYAGKPMSVKLPMYESHGWLREWYDMTRATTLAGLKAAIEPHAMLFGNIMSAGSDGHIFYIYNAAVPIRDPAFDWSRPVDGSNPQTEWKGYYPVSALPQLTDPQTGWMQNCNTSPFLLTSSGNPDPNQYPRYMVGEGKSPPWDAENPRGLASVRVLESRPKFTFDDWARAVFDTHVALADEKLSNWIAGVHPEAASIDWRPALTEALGLLRRWDHVSGVDSIPMAVFFSWVAAMKDKPERPAELTASLESGLKDLSGKFGRWKAPYGEFNRIARATGHAIPPFGYPGFTGSEPSLPIPAADGGLGTVFTVNGISGSKGKLLYGVHGDTYVSVVEFGPRTRALSVMTYGESADPKSPHFIDQMPLYAAGRLKPSWFTLDEVRRGAEAAYHPGEAPSRVPRLH